MICIALCIIYHQYDNHLIFKDTHATNNTMLRRDVQKSSMRQLRIIVMIYTLKYIVKLLPGKYKSSENN